MYNKVTIFQQLENTRMYIVSLYSAECFSCLTSGVSWLLSIILNNCPDVLVRIPGFEGRPSGDLG